MTSPATMRSANSERTELRPRVTAFLRDAERAPPLAESPSRLASGQLSYRVCIAVFLVATTIAVLTPVKEYYLGSYVTRAFDEVREDVVGRGVGPLGVAISGVHYFDTFNRPRIPLIDRTTGQHLQRGDAAPLWVTDLLVRAIVRRADLLAHLPADLLNRSVNLMEDGYAPLCGSAASATPAQLLFGNWFPAIRHEFCRDFVGLFPRDRFFNHLDKTPVDAALAHVGSVTLGLIAVVNMSELYLRHFDDALVVRKIMKSVQQGFVGLALPEYTDAAADAIVAKYATGIPLAQAIALLPGSLDVDHIALVDLLGLRDLLAFYLLPQQLTMGVNVNGEPAILAEVTHATTAYFTPDFLVNTVGMHLISTMHLAPFWDCAIHHTTMDKAISVSDVDALAVQHCGEARAAILPIFAVNLMFLFQKEQRDYSKLDNTTTYTLGHHHAVGAETGTLQIPEKLGDSSLLSMDGSAWTKPHAEMPQQAPPTTPYGYLFTPDCRGVVDVVMQQSGRNVQKYQAYLGDGLGSCAFHDSQETPPQTLCRLWLTSQKVQFRTLNGSGVAIPSCDALVSATATATVQVLQQQNLRQLELFLVDTTHETRRIRIQDNTSRQIRTFLLILNLIGATYYVLEYLRILKSVWVFVHNSLYQPIRFDLRRRSTKAPEAPPPPSPSSPLPLPETSHLKLQQLLYFDPALGAIQHPGTMALLYLGAVGALSNVFSLVCSANLSTDTSDSSVVIVCQPAIPLSSATLLLTTLSSTYWITQVALQTRTLAERLDFAANPTWYKNTLGVAGGAVTIHFACKAGAHYFFENVELRSDPHLYAVAGGVLLSWLQVALFATINYQTTARRLKAAIAPWVKTKRRNAAKRLSASHPRSHSDSEARERSFLAKWGASQLDDAFHYCATPFIAQQLQAFSRRQERQRVAAAARSGSSAHHIAFAATARADKEERVEIQEFVMVHCAAGAANHLETVAWQARLGSSAAFLTDVRSLRRSRTSGHR